MSHNSTPFRESIRFLFRGMPDFGDWIRLKVTYGRIAHALTLSSTSAQHRLDRVIRRGERAGAAAFKARRSSAPVEA